VHVPLQQSELFEHMLFAGAQQVPFWQTAMPYVG
jgi:hypothetical protein